ncbi:MBL fold metallo-hydrolase [Kitasatospora sp. A2-31]|uniref:MBL fold metallo-hydrolase n=1 Tax=Kitasatospora sp. A2-31 TaxID=2916414 RepID=UPI001EE9C89A|nr:MBL fold metallo-hydrolase [Kitasatospora sp. A2-31]MCG6496602.1 MBL fold metallo-hydrolase [Kitasatospora sp. A2-31]MCG6497394.1 MBL fold metallo-hydrolase [Kitasatospora sp. A2-31]MCG6500152.1 MBL fold metallo-hydrolase [Kitasatospora sp. A2-31]
MTTSRANVSAIAEDLYVWLPPKRGWGLANCGLLASPRTALWIDTPYDPSLAAEFLAESRKRLPEGVDVDRVVVTHANGDHLWGAGVLPDAEVIATHEALEHIHYEPAPKQQHALVAGGDPDSPLGGYLQRHFGQFDWSQTEPVHPQTVFRGELELRVGEYPVQITGLPAAHTGGDLMVHLPYQRTVFTGDVVFGSTPEQPGDHPSHWSGPLENIIGACEQALATGAEIFVPGHGPVLDRSGVQAHIAYLAHVRERAHALHAEGTPALDAARRIIAEQRYPELGLPERLVLTVSAEYRHLDGSAAPNVLEAMTQVALVAREIEASAGQTGATAGPRSAHAAATPA